jgi:hypothetical protein
MNRHLFFFGIVALAGCSSQPGPLTQTEYCNRYAQDVCAGVSPACLMTDASCTAGRLAQCATEAQSNATATRDFIPPNAEACLNKVNAVYGKLKQGAVALGAADIQAMNDACGNVYRGTALAYGSCKVDADCLDPLICDKGYCGTARTVAQGAGCANIGETCPPGSYCSSTTGIWFCSSKVGLGGVCDASNPCLENLRCMGVACAVQLGIGEVCTVDQDCDSGFCEPYAGLCALDVRFANGSAACKAMGGP